MPRILNRPPTFPKKTHNGSYLVKTKGSATTTSSSGLSRSQRSHVLSGMLQDNASVRSSVRSSRSGGGVSLTYDTSMSNAAYDGDRVQNSDFGWFVDFYDPESCDDLSPLWR